MAPKQPFLYFLTLAVLLVSSLVPSASVNAQIPVTADGAPALADVEQASSDSTVLSLVDFASSLKNGGSDIRGIHVPGIMAYRVVQQPSGQNGFVSGTRGTVTQFSLASNYGSIGMLAHNYLAGEKFVELQIDDIIHIVYGDGSFNTFKVKEIHRFQALQPTSPSSDFIDLETNEELTATTLFKRMYAGKTHLTLQTCIAAESESSWGRLFIIAEPIS